MQKSTYLAVTVPPFQWQKFGYIKRIIIKTNMNTSKNVLFKRSLCKAFVSLICKWALRHKIHKHQQWKQNESEIFRINVRNTKNVFSSQEREERHELFYEKKGMKRFPDLYGGMWKILVLCFPNTGTVRRGGAFPAQAKDRCIILMSHSHDEFFWQFLFSAVAWQGLSGHLLLHVHIFLFHDDYDHYWGEPQDDLG